MTEWKKMLRFPACRSLVVGIIFLLSSGEVHAMKALKQVIPEQVHYSMQGIVGERVQANLENWILPAPDANPGIIEMFRVRDRHPVPNLVPWAGEFIGKYLISAIQANRMLDDPRLSQYIEKLIGEFISTQAEDGYLGPFRKQERLLGHWDLWGHYHAMLALLMWYEETNDQAALDAARKAADLICRIYLDTPKRPLDAGMDETNLSVITSLGRLYRHTHEERYLRMMKVIEQDWEKAGDFFRKGLAGVDFYKTPRPRWESLHSIQGLVELYQITGHEDYKTAFINLWNSIRRLDRHNTGGFSTGEQAIGNPYTPGAIETCCTTAWAALCVDMLQLTGESIAADELELSLYNSILGSQNPSGRWWTYNTPMDGMREASAHTIVFQARAGTPELNCCSVNAPRGIGAVSEWAVLIRDTKDLVINYYGPMKASFQHPTAGHVRIDQVTDYPVDSKVEISLDMEQKMDGDLYLRIPSWSKSTQVTVSSGSQSRTIPQEDCPSGSYLLLKGPWTTPVTISIVFDFSIHTWIGDLDQAGKISLYRGPLLLAFDQIDNPYDCKDIEDLDYSNLEYQLLLTQPQGVPLLKCEFKTSSGSPMVLRDFASAGARGTEYRSWLPVHEAPPPSPVLLEPRYGAVLPLGVNRFSWLGMPGKPQINYSVLLSDHPDFKNILLSKNSDKNWVTIDEPLMDGKTYYWKVIATGPHGSTTSRESVAFRVDATLPNLLVKYPSLIAYREDGLICGSMLDGNADPTYGALDESRNISPTANHLGQPDKAIKLSGNGMVRYLLPSFPLDDYTVTIWVRPDEFPANKLSQIFCSWSKPGDDPLRIVIEQGMLFARVEGMGTHGTTGIPLEKGKWIHLGVVKKGNLLSLYINGRHVTETNIPPKLYTTNSSAIALGGNPYFGGDEFFIGCLDDFAFWANAMTPEQIQGIYEKGLNLEKR